MRKFLLLAQVTLSTYLVYRLNFILWRVRVVFGLILLYFLWGQAFHAETTVAGYTKPMILSYIFLANFLNAVVMSSKTDQIAGDIRSGAIINQILKPLNYFLIVGTRELVDKGVNIFFSIIEVTAFILFLRPDLYIPSHPVNYIAFAGFLILALLISFYISFGLAIIAFWTSEIWAPRFIFMIFFSLVAGTLFPLDIFPKPIYEALLFTPFPYLVYVPAKVLIHGITPDTAFLAVRGIIWVIGAGALTTWMWKKGLREFAFFGR